MELRQYIETALKWWWLMILSTALAATTSYMVSQGQVPIYHASTTLLVGQSIIQATNVNNADFTTSQLLAQTYADMAQRQPVLQGVVETLNLADTWQGLKGRVQAKPVSGTQLLEITVEAGSPEEARVTADEVVRQLTLLSPTASPNQEQEGNQLFVRQRLENLKVKIERGQQQLAILDGAMADSLSVGQVQELQAEINDLEQLIAGWENNYTQLLIFVEGQKSANYLAVIEPAQADSQLSGLKTRQNILLAGLVGLLLSLGIIFLLEYLDDTLKPTDDLSQTLGLTALGMIDQMKGKQDQNRLIISHEPFSPVSEAYRMIRSNIRFMSVDRPVKSILVTSATLAEGKSVTVANLGIVMAQAGFKTIMVDTDLRRPVLHYLFQVSKLKGLTDLLCLPKLEISRCLKNTGVENLYLITSGVLPPNPSELLGSQRMEQILVNLKEMADVVIFDSPPVLAVTDAAVLSNRIDGVILVTRAGKTRRELARRASFTLRQAGAHLLGGVLNGTAGTMESYPYHYSPYELEPADQLTSDPQATRATIEPFLNEQHVST